jgi:hypothetical protein
MWRLRNFLMPIGKPFRATVYHEIKANALNSIACYYRPIFIPTRGVALTAEKAEPCMTGESDLPTLLRSMQPVLCPGVFVFVTLPSRQQPDDGLSPVMVFREREGTTLVVDQAAAQRAKLNAIFPCRMITLNVHSSLEAVGFLAAITTRLASANIGVNPVSAFHHDHLFVPADRAELAMRLLQELAQEA